MPPRPDQRPLTSTATWPRGERRPRFCLMGFWGVPNFGDEWLFRSAQNVLRAEYPECDLTGLVLSVATERRLGEHADGLRLINGFFPEPSFFLNLGAVVRSIAEADLVLIGGGGLINDTYTLLSIPRYAVPALLGKALGTPVLWWGLGVVPPRNPVLKGLALWTLRRSAAVLVRDRVSRSYLADHGIESRPCADLSALDPSVATGALPAEAAPSSRTLVLNFRDAVPALMTARSRFLARQLERFDRIILIAAEPCDEDLYRPLIKRVAGLGDARAATVEMVPANAYARIREAIASASVVVSERLHVSLFALSVGVPTVVLSYENKVNEIIGSMYPSVSIYPRDDFWGSPAFDAFRIPERQPPAQAPGLAATEAIAAAIRAAGQSQPPLVDRLGAFAWLVLLLSLGGAVATAKFVKRKSYALAARLRAPAAELAADETSGAPDAEGAERGVVGSATAAVPLNRRRSVTVLH